MIGSFVSIPGVAIDDDDDDDGGGGIGRSSTSSSKTAANAPPPPPPQSQHPQRPRQLFSTLTPPPRNASPHHSQCRHSMNRRVIFPTLHRESLPSANANATPRVANDNDPRSSRGGGRGDDDDVGGDGGMSLLHRANSLDGIISMPLRGLSLFDARSGRGGGGGTNDAFASSSLSSFGTSHRFDGGNMGGGKTMEMGMRGRNDRDRGDVVDPRWTLTRRRRDEQQRRWEISPDGGRKAAASSLGDAMRQRPYYFPVAFPPPYRIATTTTTATGSTDAHSPGGPPRSILRFGGVGSGGIGVGGNDAIDPTTTTTTVAASSSPSPARRARSRSSSCCSGDSLTVVTQPTLASSTAIDALLRSRDNGGGHDRGSSVVNVGGIGSSEDELQRLTRDHSPPPTRTLVSSPRRDGGSPEECRDDGRGKLRKSQSTSLVEGKINHGGARRRQSSSPTPSSSSATPSRHDSFEFLGGGGGGGGSTNDRRRRHAVSFDPHIIVHEFRITNYERRGGGKWWNENELEEFKREAIQRIRSRSVTIVPTGTGRSLALPTRGGGGEKDASSRVVPGNVSFNHPALGCEDEYDPREPGETTTRAIGDGDAMILCDNRNDSRAVHWTGGDSIANCLSHEIRNILVVDPHETFLSLFRKSLKHMIPHAAVATARSAEEALSRIEAAQKAFPVKDGGSFHGFDVIIIEENLSAGPPSLAARRNDASTQSAGDDSVQRRWNMSSGSCLCRHLAECERLHGSDACSDGPRLTLIIGVSARLHEHRERLENAGVDFVWGKPPPEMNATLCNSLLKTLMKKRRRRVDFRLFDTG